MQKRYVHDLSSKWTLDYGLDIGGTELYFLFEFNTVCNFCLSFNSMTMSNMIFACVLFCRLDSETTRELSHNGATVVFRFLSLSMFIV